MLQNIILVIKKAGSIIGLTLTFASFLGLFFAFILFKLSTFISLIIFKDTELICLIELSSIILIFISLNGILSGCLVN